LVLGANYVQHFRADLEAPVRASVSGLHWESDFGAMTAAFEFTLARLIAMASPIFYPEATVRLRFRKCWLYLTLAQSSSKSD
jgi:hypothetical protein